MNSNHTTYLKTLQDTLTSATSIAISKSALVAFKQSNDKIRSEEGIPKIPIYSNVRFVKATGTRPTARLYIYDKAQTDVRWHSPMQNATGVVFMRPVKLGGKTITQVAHAFIPSRLQSNANPKRAPFKRVGKARLPIVKLKTSTLYDYYSFVMVQSRLMDIYNEVFISIMAKELNKKLVGL